MTEDYYLTLAIAGIITLLAGWSSLNFLRKARIIEDTPTSRIRSAHQGYVELVGQVKNLADEPPLLSKLGGDPCVWFRYKIERYESNGKNSNWRTIESHSSERPFLLDDSTGVCYLLPQRAEVSTFRKHTWHGSERYPSGRGNRGGIFGRRYRYTEELLCDADPLYAIGLFQTRHPPAAVQRNNQRMAEILNEWKQDYDRLVQRFDRNGDGEIDLTEWDLARQKALRAAEREQRNAAPTEPVHTLAYSPSRRQPFIIATSEPESLSKRFRYYALGLFVVSLASTAAFGWTLWHPQNFN